VAQDVAEIVPRVRRAIEGPRPLDGADPTRLTDEMVEASAADAIGDLILYTAGRWPHQLAIESTDPGTGMSHYSVDPPLAVEEESLVAAQAALTFFFHDFRDKKVSEDQANEGQSWSYTLSANTLRDQFKLLRDQRDLALEAMKELHPVLARAASLFHVLDRQVDAIMSGYDRKGGLGGGFELDPGTAWPGPLNDSRG
jgi:hypothetical protein